MSTSNMSAWTAVESTPALSPVAEEPGDRTGQALAALYRDTAGQEHPDWDEYYRAMVHEHRLLLTLTVTHGCGGRAG